MAETKLGNTQSLLMEKIPPQNIEAEVAKLGSMIVQQKFGR